MYAKESQIDENGCEVWCFKVVDPDQEIENIWEEFEDVPMDEDANGELVLAHDWRQSRQVRQGLRFGNGSMKSIARESTGCCMKERMSKDYVRSNKDMIFFLLEGSE